MSALPTSCSNRLNKGNRRTMLIPPLALPVLNATAILHLNASHSLSNPSANAEVFCWKQRPPGSPQRQLTSWHDCMQLAQRLVSSGKPKAQIDFSRDPGAGIPTPYRLYGGSCVFEIDIDPEQTREKSWAASFWEISTAAMDIFTQCVAERPHLIGLGGITKVGRDQVLDISVYGQRASKSFTRLEPGKETRHVRS